MRLILFIIALCTFVMLQAQSPIDYHHKSIRSTLKKLDIQNYETISASPEIAKEINGQFFKTTHRTMPYLYIGRVNSCRAQCTKDQDCNSEYFDYFMIFNTQKQVRLVKVFNYQATHGQAITSKGWLKQFVGYKAPQKLEIRKEIDIISGATISAKAITEDIKTRSKQISTLE